MSRRQIWKYPFKSLIGQTEFIMPGGAKILSAQMQGPTLCLWAVVDPMAPPEPRFFEIYGTGHRIPENVDISRFVATVQMGQFVWHIFEV